MRRLTTTIAVAVAVLISGSTSFGVVWDVVDFDFGTAGNTASYNAALTQQNAGFLPAETLGTDSINLAWGAGEWGGERQTPNGFLTVPVGDYTMEFRARANAGNKNIEFNGRVAGLGGWRLAIHSGNANVTIQDTTFAPYPITILDPVVDPTMFHTYRMIYVDDNPGTSGTLSVYVDNNPVASAVVVLPFKPGEASTVMVMQPFDTGNFSIDIGHMRWATGAHLVPEPSTLVLLALGGLGLLLVRRWRNKA